MTQKHPSLTIALTLALAGGWVAFSGLPTLGDPPEPSVAASPPASPEPLRLAQNEADESPAPEAAQDKPVAQNNPRLAKATLRKARENLRQRDSIQADIVETIAIGNRKFHARGTYLQGTDMRLRLEYFVRVGSEAGSLLEVCDGQVLWTRHIIGEKDADETDSDDTEPEADNGTAEAVKSAAPETAADGSDTAQASPADESNDKGESDSQENIRITRRDIDKIRKAAAENQNVPERVLIVELGLGGLPALLASIEESIQFNTISEERIDSQVFTVVEGGWTLEALQAFGAKDAAARLADHVPERVRIYFDRDTLFPRRILYLKRHPERDFFRPMLTLDFVNVLLDGPVDEMAFQFVPPEGVLANDITELYLRRLASGAKRFDAPGEGEPSAEPGDNGQDAEQTPSGEANSQP